MRPDVSLDRPELDERHRSDLESPVTEIRFHARFPVDVRHNAKIRREDLKAWAEASG